MTFDVQVEVSLRPGISDPEGATIERALPALGFDGVSDVRVGKSIRFSIDADDRSTAESSVQSICEKFLSNPVIEDVSIVVSGQAEASDGSDS
ncbi:MAG: phosphoribosylformylglycinamidine synthase subunit PurS [Microthrixaceae bacterium]